MKSVTVIIPTYNRWPIICDAIDSVLNQSYRNTQCWVVDDASTDDTPKLLRAKYGSQISLIEQPSNQGQSVCRNVGVESCGSDYVCFLDSDDLMMFDAVEKRVEVLSANPNAVIAYGLAKTPRKNPLLNKKNPGDTLSLEEYCDNKHWCDNNGLLICRETFLRDGRYNASMRIAEDVELLLRLLAQHAFLFCGTEVAEVRDICQEQRVGLDHDKIIRQGSLFSKTILNNPQIHQRINSALLQKLIYSDLADQCRNLYRAGRYHNFRKFYRSNLKQVPPLYRIRFFNRFLLRFIMSHIKTLFHQESPKRN